MGVIIMTRLQQQKLKILDLFSGLGGFSLGLERTGNFKTVAFCEIDKFCTLILQKHWKGVKIYNDVKEIKKERLEADGIPSPDVITGGFPCQPFSVAGRRQGTGDNRYLWPEMFRAIKEFKPRWIIAENVRGIINIEDGVVFERVHADLESQDYETQTFIIPAAGVGAPHRRDRVWIVAHSDIDDAKQSIRKSNEAQNKIQKEYRKENNSSRQSSRASEVWESNNRYEDVANSRRTIRGEQSSRNKESIESGTPQETKRSIDSDSIARSSEREKIMANTESFGSNVGKINQSKKESGEKRILRSEVRRVSSNVANTNSERGRLRNTQRQNAKDVRKSSQGQRHGWWDIEPDVGRVADGVQGRIHRLKGLGNSIVPQIAEEIGKAILKVDLIDRDSKA